MKRIGNLLEAGGIAVFFVVGCSFWWWLICWLSGSDPFHFLNDIWEFIGKR